MFAELQPMDYLRYGIGFICLIVILNAMMKRWFWMILFGVGTFSLFLATLYFFMNSQTQKAMECVIATAVSGVIYLKLWDTC